MGNGNNIFEYFSNSLLKGIKLFKSKFDFTSCLISLAYRGSSGCTKLTEISTKVCNAFCIMLLAQRRGAPTQHACRRERMYRRVCMWH